MQLSVGRLGIASARRLLQVPNQLQYSARNAPYTPGRSAVVVRRWYSAKRAERETAADARLDREIADIQQRVADYKKQLRRHVVSSFKSRELSSSISALGYTMADAQRKKAAVAAATNANTLAAMPAHVSIEVLSNGTTHMPPCVAIRTPLKTYLFNAPEGTSRFLPALRYKPSNIFDIFVTRGIWDNIGGISSILLAKENNSLPTRLHGAVNVKHFLECIRPFQDSDFGSVRYPSSKPDPDDPVQYPSPVEECTLATHDSYEDPGLKIQYIPLLPDPKAMQEDGGRKNTTDVAYYIEMKDAPRRIDPTRLIKMAVPKGPLIGKLKNGESITLANGTVVTPDDVMIDDERSVTERRRLLIVDAADEGYARSLYESTVVTSLTGPDAAHHVDFVVHLTPEAVLRTEEYQRWAEGLGEQCRHIVVNGSGPVVPPIDSMYKHARLLHELQPALFDELRPRGWRGIVSQEKDLEVQEGRWTRAAPLQRWHMRKLKGEEPIIMDLKEVERREGGQLALGEEWRETAKEEMTAAREAAAALGAASPSDSSFPRITFLGTSSATPSKYRNVSGYLLETSTSSAFLVDVGEATYGQLRVLLDDEACEELMVNLHAVFITHAHQDHMNGLYTVIEKRRQAFEKRGLAYRNLVLVCNRNVMKPLKTYTHCFEDLERYVEVVDLATQAPAPSYKKSPPGSPPSSPKKARLDHNFVQSPTTAEMLPKIPAEYYDRERWGLEGVKAVQVHHTRMANGFVFTTTDGKKIVFSGDTKPCELLVEHGMDADLLIHEATFEDGHEQDAFRKKHSTMGQAVDIATKMRAKHCILTHFSARYPKVPALPAYLDEKKIGLAMDGLRVGFDRLDLVPLMTPIYRQVYRDELFDIELRKCQKDLKKDEKLKENGKKIEAKTVKV